MDIQTGTRALAKAPTRENLAALACGLELPRALLARVAAVQCFGFEEDLPVSDEARAVVAHMENLAAWERVELLAIVEAYVRNRG
ncbi:hypothetical protein GCM10027168_69290 [Streptomyces capparidis]